MKKFSSYVHVYVAALVILFPQSFVLADGQFFADLWESDPDWAVDASLNKFYWGQTPTWRTYNDWNRVHTEGYETYYALPTNIETLNDELPTEPYPAQPDISLYWWTPSSVVIPLGTMAGYQWDVPTEGLGSDQVIVGLKIDGGMWNYPRGGGDPPMNPAVWQAIDERGNVLWEYDHAGTSDQWLVEAPEVYFPDNPTRSISFVMKTIGDPRWAWQNNAAYLQGITLYTENYQPTCGDWNHPYPFGDLNKDCKVDLDDFAMIASEWLTCYSPNPSDCQTGAPPYIHDPNRPFYGYFATHDSIEDVSGYTNLNHLHLWPVERAQKYIDNKSYMLVDLNWQFFEWVGEFQWAPRSDALTQWAFMKSILAPYIDYVGAFYLMDEPYWNGLTFEDLQYAAQIIKADFPDIPILIIEAYVALDELPSMPGAYPSEIDWVGVNRYSDFSKIPALISKLKAVKSANQKIVLVPQGFLGQGDTDEQVADWSYDYHNLYLSDPDIIGQLVFLSPAERANLYPGHAPTPLTLAAQQAIGADVVQYQCGDIFHRDYLPEDFDQNCRVDMNDMLVFIQHWLDTSSVIDGSFLDILNPSFESPYVTPSPGWSSTVDDWDQWGGTGAVSGGNFQPSTPYGDQWAFLDYGGWAGQEGYLYQNVGIVENNTDYQITFLSGGDLSSAVASLTVQVLAKTTVDQFWTWQVLDTASVIVPEPSYMQENALTLNSGTGFSGNDLYILFKAGGDNDGVARRALIDNVSIFRLSE